jgi:endonuclease/exonuclease/phosphatase family metal-dependent hydrolase
VLAIIAGIGLAYSSLKAPSETTMKDFDDLLLSPDAKKKRERHPCIDFLRVFGLTTTLVLIMMTLYVVFDSPAVLARWTAGNYLFVILFASLVIDIFLTILVILPKAILRLNRAVLFMWNLVFALMLLFTIVSQRIAFPPTPTSPALEVRPNVRAPQYLVLALNILLHPILFVDAIIASKQLVKLRPTNAVLGISFVLSNGIAAAVLVMHLFTNVWGYLEPVSHYFRNGFYIPFVFIGFFLISVVGVVDGKWLVKCCKRKNKKKAEGDFGQITEAEEDGVGDLMAGFTTDFQTDLEADFEVTMERSYDEFPNNGPRLLSPPNDRHRAHHSRNQWSKKAKALIILLFFGMTVASIVGCLMTESRPQIPPKPMNITILQYNIRQGVSTTGRVVDQQLDLIRQINPDIIGLEECDSTRVFLNNFDIVRFFANKLQYYSFYGPKTTSGTFGVCILSRFPLYDPFVIYTYSDKDEVATSSVTIDIPEYGNLTLYVSHPDGSSQAMMSQTSELLSRVSNLTNSQKVLSIGDFNYNTSSVYYKLTRNHLLDPWYVLYPSGVNENGQNKSADFDHIFLDFSWRNKVRNVTYIYPPASFSDHPVHYVTLEL